VRRPAAHKQAGGGAACADRRRHRPIQVQDAKRVMQRPDFANSSGETAGNGNRGHGFTS
jgi:hypothetical protein